MEVPVKVGIIYGSTRPGRFCDTVARWTAAQIASRAGFAIELVDPAGPANGLRERLAACDAFVVVTPEYNHGYPAPLKQLIDSFGEEWHAKPVGFISYGGISGGLRAVEQLRLVFAELHAVTIRDSVSFAGAGSSLTRPARCATLSGPSAPWKPCCAGFAGGPLRFPTPAACLRMRRALETPIIPRWR